MTYSNATRLNRGSKVRLTPYGKDASDSWDKDGSDQGEILNYLNDRGASRIFQIASYTNISENRVIALVQKMIQDGMLTEASEEMPLPPMAEEAEEIEEEEF